MTSLTKNPKPKTKKYFFHCRLEDLLNSSLAQSLGNLCSWQDTCQLLDLDLNIPSAKVLTLCVRRSDNACHYMYVHGVHKGVNPHHKTHVKSATTGIHLQFALIMQAIHGWTEALAMHFFLLKEHCTTQRIKI